jgi:[amino group carrier protein]-lysine/ornithine hydrolase
MPEDMNVPETLFGLVQAYSPTGQEKPAVDFLVQRMQALGFTQAFADEAGNAVGVMGAGPRQVVLLGHIDTVPGEIPVQIAGADREPHLLYGRGSVDAKGPLAAFTDAVAAVGAVDSWQFVVIGAVGEEGDSPGAQYVAPRYRPDFAIIGEPSRSDRITLGYKGSAWARLTVRRTLHHTAGRDESACEAAVQVWNALLGWAANFNADRPRAFDRILPTLRKLDSGGDGFEEWAVLHVGTRLPPDLSPDDWYARLNEIPGIAGTSGLAIERTGFPIRAYQGEKNTPLVRAFLAGIRAEGGQPGFVLKTGTADLNIVAPLWGCPALAYGPGDSSLDHTPDEHLALDEYAQAVRVLTAVLKQLSQKK